MKSSTREGEKHSIKTKKMRSGYTRVVHDDGQEAGAEKTYMRSPRNVRNVVTVSNPSRSVRGLMLSKGNVIILQPGETKPIPPEFEDEVRALFETEHIKRFVDAGLLSISE